jgi:tetraprenyl-beta-curcumene synthase
LRAVSGEVDRWRARAAIIPDIALRTDALGALARKRASTDGAALFWTLPDDRSPCLLRLLVAYEITADFLDSVSERGAHMGLANGLQLHLALSEALDPGAPISAYYLHHPWSDDGGYLLALVATCRERCTRLPSYEGARMLTVRAATLTQVLGLNHELDPYVRDGALREWIAQRQVGAELAWFEWTAAASAWLTVLALLALAAEKGREQRCFDEIYAAYLPWISLTGTMLDSYVDQVEDAAAGDHSYIAHYPDADIAVGRVCELVRYAAVQARALPNGGRHAVIVACMVAMYLSKDSARTSQMRASTRSLMRAGGSLARLLLPVLRLWRIVYTQRSS